MVRTVFPSRVHKDFYDIINFIRAKYIMEGKKPPTSSEITQKISKNVNKEALLSEMFRRS